MSRPNNYFLNDRRRQCRKLPLPYIYLILGKVLIDGRLETICPQHVSSTTTIRNSLPLTLNVDSPNISTFSKITYQIKIESNSEIEFKCISLNQILIEIIKIKFFLSVKKLCLYLYIDGSIK